MAATAVCISRTDGAQGEFVGIDVAAELGYRYVDQEIVTRAAEKAQVDRSAVENAERRKSFVRRLLEGLASPAALPEAGLDGRAFSPGLVAPPADLWDIRDVIRSVIGDIADEGRVVIVSHAASMALAGNPNVLRVLVTASPGVRADRISHGGKWLEPAAAAAAIRDADRNRQDYFRRFYDVDREDATHYDVVVSTDVLTAKQAAAIVCNAARIAGA
jgi:cytidylate kinase-like protein